MRILNEASGAYLTTNVKQGPTDKGSRVGSTSRRSFPEGMNEGEMESFSFLILHQSKGNCLKRQ